MLKHVICNTRQLTISIDTLTLACVDTCIHDQSRIKIFQGQDIQTFPINK